jgi:subtilisin family serine protease
MLPASHKQLNLRASRPAQTGVAALDKINARLGAKAVQQMLRPTVLAGLRNAAGADAAVTRWYTVELPQNANIAEAVKAYAALKGIVELAEPEYKIVQTGTDPVTLQWLPNDTLFARQWHLQNTGQEGGAPDADIDMPEAWDIERGNPNVLVALMDGGIDTTHPDLLPSLWGGRGFNFIANNNLFTVNNHGNHVAGILAAKTNNTTIVAGVAGGDGSTGSGARLMGCQVFGADGSPGSITAFFNAYIWSANNGAAISQNSWGYASPGVINQAILDGIDYFVEYGGGGVLRNGLVVFSAGNQQINNADSASSQWPGAYERVISVIATNNTDRKSWYSSYGLQNDICAPGGETNEFAGGPIVNGGRKAIISTVGVANGSIAYLQGTSMAAPQVAGVAALIASKAMAKLSADDVKELILQGANPIDQLNTSSLAGGLGAGRLNAYNALAKTVAILPQAVADTPRNFRAIVNGCDVQLSWALAPGETEVMVAMSDNAARGGFFGLPYGSSYVAGDKIDGKGIVIYKGNGNSFTVSNLNPGGKYYFKIWSVRSGGIYSMGITADKAITAPQAIAGFAASEVTDCSATLQWTNQPCYTGQVMILCNTSNVFGTPSGLLQPGDAVPGGGTVLFEGNGNSFTHSNLKDTTRYYYRIYDVVSFTSMLEANVLTLTHIKSLQLEATTTTMQATWHRTDCFGGRVLLAFNQTGSFGTPNGSYQPGDAIQGGGQVLYTGTLTGFLHSNLTPATRFYYAVWPVEPDGSYGFRRTASLATQCEGSAPALPITDAFDAQSLSVCLWDTVVVDPSAGIRPTISIVNTGTGPTSNPAEGGAMLRFNSYFCLPGAQIRLLSKPFSTAGVNSVDVSFRWYEDDSDYNSEDYLGEGVSVQWSTNGANWQSVIQYNRLPAIGGSGWKWKQVTLPAGAANQSTVYVGLLFTSQYGHNCYMDSLSIHQTKYKATNGTATYAVAEFTNDEGITHYYDSLSHNLLSIKKLGNDIGRVGMPGFDLRVGGNTGSATILHTGSNYVTNPGGWRTFGRYWSMTLPSQPGTDMQVRFYYTTDDYDALQATALSLTPPGQLSSHQQMIAYRVNDPSNIYNEDPASGHVNIPRALGYATPGFWEVPALAAPASIDSWMYTNLGDGVHAADYITKVPGGGGLGIGANGGGALPLFDITLNAVASGGIADVTWSFSGVFHVFVVERSLDAATWTQINSAKASSAQQVLSFADLLPSAGLAYYRIKGLTFGGKYIYSNVSFAGNISLANVSVFPNPAKDVIMVTARNRFESRLLSLDGKVLLRQTGSGQIAIQVGQLPTGIYVLNVSDEKGQLLKTQRISVMY